MIPQYTLVTVLILFFCLNSNATVYTKSSNTDYSSSTGWSPSYPGTTIEVGDEVVIDASVTLDVNIENVKGTLTINNGASLTGTKEIKKSDAGGVMTVTGTLSIKKIKEFGGTLTVSGSVTTTDEIEIKDGTLTLNSGAPITAKKITLEGNSTSTITGTISLSDKLEIKGNSTITINSAATVNVKSLKVKDNGILTCSGTITTTDNFEAEGNAVVTLNTGSSTIVGNDFKAKDNGAITINGTVTVEDDIKIENNGVVTANGILNLCDDDGTEGENKFEVKDNGTITGTGTVCMCSSNSDNTYTNSGTTGASITINQNCNGPLPIELADFNLELNGNVVTLKWTTFSELENDYFEIQRSINAKQFETIGKLDGAGTTNEITNYSYTDPTPHRGINFYRLKHTDFNGRFDYTRIFSIETSLPRHQVQLEIFPTLVTAGESLNVSLSDYTLEDIRFITLSGESHPSNYSQETNSIEVPHHLPKGLNFISITTNNQNITFRILVR